jgi:hypothetical protein
MLSIIARRCAAALLIAALFAATPRIGRCGVIAEVPVWESDDSRKLGQSVTIPGAHSWNNIRFNFYDLSGNPIAVRGLYIFDQYFSGSQNGPLTTDTGFYAENTSITGSQYVFAPSVELQGGSTYWFYPSAGGGIGRVAFANSDQLAGGDRLYVSAGSWRTDTGRDMAFLLEGDEIVTLDIPPVPEPAGVGLLG